MTGAPSEVVFRRAQLNAQIRALLPGAVERVGGCKRAAEITGATVRAARGWVKGEHGIRPLHLFALAHADEPLRAFTLAAMEPRA